MPPFPVVEPGTPGIYPGTIGAFPNVGIDLQTITIAPFAILSSSIANDVNFDGGLKGVNTTDGGNEETCDHPDRLARRHGTGDNPLDGSPRASAPTSSPLPVISAGTLNDYKTYLLSVVRVACPALLTRRKATTCGAGYDGGANRRPGHHACRHLEPGRRQRRDRRSVCPSLERARGEWVFPPDAGWSALGAPYPPRAAGVVPTFVDILRCDDDQ